MRLEKRYWEEIVAHAREEVPNECCGVLAGKDGRVVKLYRMVNSEHSPYRYDMDRRQWFEVYKEIDASGWDVLGIYHSHTHTEAYPSPTDVQQAFWPDSYYLILSLRQPDTPELRVFRIQEGRISEEPLEIVS